MDLLSPGTRRAIARWDGRPRQILALLCAALAAVLALTGGGAQPAPADPPAAEAQEHPAAGYVAAVVPAGPAALAAAPGDRVDIYATDLDAGSDARLLAPAVRVLRLASDPRAGAASAYLVVELTDEQARAFAAAGDDAALTVVVRAPDG